MFVVSMVVARNSRCGGRGPSGEGLRVGEMCPELVVKMERKTVLWRTQYAETWNRSQAICEKKDIRQSKKARQKEGRSMGEEPTSELCSRGQLLYVSPPTSGRRPGPSSEHGDKTTRIGRGLPPIKTPPPPQCLIILQILAHVRSSQNRTLAAIGPASVVIVEDRENDGL